MSEDRHFKEEILKNIHDFEEDLIKKVNTKMKELNSDYKKFHQNINDLSENNKKLINSLINENFNLEKITSLEQFRNKADSILITHEIRINNNIEEISSIKTKYDKALIENLLVPGFVGPSCQFKNIGEFIIYYISEVSKIKSEKDMMRNSFKELRIKTDSSMRTVLNMNESLVRRCNDYTDSRFSDFKKLVNEKIDYVNTKEKEIKEIINIFKEEQKIFENNKNNFGNELKEEILSSLDVKMNEIKKNQEETIYKAINQNNNFIENYVNQILENKFKIVENNILDIQNKLKELKDISNEKNFYMNNINISKKENINNKNNLPRVSYLSQKNLTIFKSENKEEKKINKNENNDYIINKTPSNSNNNELNENYISNNTFSNFSLNQNKTNDKILKETKVTNNINNKIISEPKLILNQNQKTLFHLKEQSNNFNEITNNIEKSIPSIPRIFKEKESSDIILKHRNSKILIFNYDQKNKNTKTIKTRLNIKKRSNNSSEFMRNFVNIKTLKNNRDSDMIEYEPNEEEKSFRNILDSLQTPKILEKRILSNDELRISHSKSNNINAKINYRNVLNNSGSDINNYILKYNKNFSPIHKKIDFKFNTLENLRKNSKNLKSERNNKLNKEKGNVFNLVKLELKSENNVINGANILANKKIMNNHITKMDYPNSFGNLYNVQVVNI